MKRMLQVPITSIIDSNRVAVIEIALHHIKITDQGFVNDLKSIKVAHFYELLFFVLCSWIGCLFLVAFLCTLNHRILAHFAVAWYLLSSRFLCESNETNSRCFWGL